MARAVIPTQPIQGLWCIALQGMTHNLATLVGQYHTRSNTAYLDYDTSYKHVVLHATLQYTREHGYMNLGVKIVCGHESGGCVNNIGR